MADPSYLVLKTPQGDVPVKDLDALKSILDNTVVTNKGLTVTKTVAVGPPAKAEQVPVKEAITVTETDVQLAPPVTPGVLGPPVEACPPPQECPECPPERSCPLPPPPQPCPIWRRSNTINIIVAAVVAILVVLLIQFLIKKFRK